MISLMMARHDHTMDQQGFEYIHYRSLIAAAPVGMDTVPPVAAAHVVGDYVESVTAGLIASSTAVASPFKASSATFALNTG